MEHFFLFVFLSVFAIVLIYIAYQKFKPKENVNKEDEKEDVVDNEERHLIKKVFVPHLQEDQSIVYSVILGKSFDTGAIVSLRESPQLLLKILDPGSEDKLSAGSPSPGYTRLIEFGKDIPHTSILEDGYLNIGDELILVAEAPKPKVVVYELGDRIAKITQQEIKELSGEWPRKLDKEVLVDTIDQIEASNFGKEKAKRSVYLKKSQKDICKILKIDNTGKKLSAYFHGRVLKENDLYKIEKYLESIYKKQNIEIHEFHQKSKVESNRPD